MNKLIIFDCDGVAWSVFHAMKGKLSHDGKDTSIIHGFLNHVFSVQNYDKADRLVFAWDSKSTVRETLFPNYKRKRKLAKKENKTEQEILVDKDRRRQFSLLKDSILYELGFRNILYQDGYEGDDIIASVVESYKRMFNIKIVARDQDLYQLIDDNVVMYDHVKGRLVTRKVIKKEYGIEPHQFREVKAICGCTTDEVPGIPGIGETKAIQYITGKLKYTTKTYNSIVSNPEVISFTRKLTTLPIEGTNTFKIAKDVCLPNRLKKVARVYGLKSFVTDIRLDEFRRNFCGEIIQSAGVEKTAVQAQGGMGKFSDNSTEF